MMVIMLGICIAGGAIFFGMWDYWISQPPPVAMSDDGGVVEPVAVRTGVQIPVSLSFVESDDFTDYAFNALKGEPDNNPTITASVGDEILFTVDNAGISPHAFGVTAEASGFEKIIPGSDIASLTAPLSPGDSGTSSFVPGSEGVYYYICTIPGHRELGMVGEILVGDVEAPEPAPAEPEEPEPEPPMQDVSTEPVPYSGPISVPAGSSTPACASTDSCYIPYAVTANVGDTITWSNDDTAAHTVTSGSPENSGEYFDSSLFLSGDTFEFTFEEAGEYPYYCVVHPWMRGIVIIN
jgi:plastocyanin